MDITKWFGKPSVENTVRTGKEDGDKKSLEKTKEKLLVLKDPELALITSLSEQIMKERGKAGADIVFLLITALIILS